MKKMLMWAVGVPFLVVGMVTLSFNDAATSSARQQVATRHP